MTRQQLEHLIRAAGDIADDDELIIIGSQAVLGQFPDAPPCLTVSMEADLYPKNKPERWDLIDGSIGEGSPFHETYGYYAQGVSETTAKLPRGWKSRLVPVKNDNTRGITGWCLDVHDLVISKCIAGREQDTRFLREARAARIVDDDVLIERLATCDVDDATRAAAAARIDRP